MRRRTVAARGRCAAAAQAAARRWLIHRWMREPNEGQQVDADNRCAKLLTAKAAHQLSRVLLVSG
jgi:hypothetical protein